MELFPLPVSSSFPSPLLSLSFLPPPFSFSFFFKKIPHFVFLPTAYQEASDYITFFFFCAIAASIWPLCSNKWHAWICGLNCTPEAQVIIYNLFNVYSPRLIKISDKSIRTIPQSTWGLFSVELTACNRVTSNRILSKELLIWCFSFCQKTSWFRFSFDNLLHSFPYNRSADLLNTICISCFSSSTYSHFQCMSSDASVQE